MPLDLEGYPVGCLSLDPEGRWLAIGTAWGRALTLVLDARTLEPVAAFPMSGGCFAPDGKTLYGITVEGEARAIAWPSRASMWRTDLDPADAHLAGIFEVGPGRLFVTLSARPDPTVLLDATSGAELWRFQEESSADGKRSVVLGPKRFYLSRRDPPRADRRGRLHRRARHFPDPRLRASAPKARAGLFGSRRRSFFSGSRKRGSSPPLGLLSSLGRRDGASMQNQ